MIINESILKDNELFFSITKLINNNLLPSDFVFFDIETTGLEAKSSALYLIGYITYTDNILKLTQLFAENFNDQQKLVDHFQSVLDNCKCVIHFNGQTFDIPYLEHKGSNFSGLESYDIYRELKNLKSFLGLNSMKQKSLEKFCGLNREDMYDGGELIDFYIRYVALTKIEKLTGHGSEYTPVRESGLSYLGSKTADEIKKYLLLHNYEDVEGMLTVASLLAAIPQNICKICEVNISDKENTIQASLILTDPVFISVFNRIMKPEKLCNLLLDDYITCTYTTDRFEFSFKKISGRLLQFFNNYKDYYYLPNEDKVIPKEIAAFMDKSLKQKATAQNCYIPYESSFIAIDSDDISKRKKNNVNPLFEGLHLFRESYNSPISFFTTSEFHNLSKERLKNVLVNLLKI